MNGRYAKKIRKEINSRIKCEALDVLKSIQDEKLYTRIKYAMKIIFKYKLGEKLGVTK